jgi:Ribbon-helix-helix protein, copG family
MSYIQAVLTLVLVVVTTLVLVAVRSMNAAVRDLLSTLRKSSAPEPSTVPRQSTDREVRPWAPPYRPTVEEQVAARTAHGASLAKADEVEGDERSTVEIPAVRIPTARELCPAPPNVARALGATGTMLGLGAEAEEPSGDRPTDEGTTRVWSAEPAPVSSGVPELEAAPELALEADLSAETLARVDAAARERGVSRAEMLRILARQGMTAEEKRKLELDKGKGKGKA